MKKTGNVIVPDGSNLISLAQWEFGGRVEEERHGPEGYAFSGEAYFDGGSWQVVDLTADADRSPLDVVYDVSNEDVLSGLEVSGDAISVECVSRGEGSCEVLSLG